MNDLITLPRATVQQALEALQEINKLSLGDHAIALPGEIDGAMDALRAALAQQAEPSICHWQQDGEDCDTYVTECKQMHTMISDPPHDWLKFCCYCGKRAEVSQWEESDE